MFQYNLSLLRYTMTLGNKNPVTVLGDSHNHAGPCFCLTVFLICIMCAKFRIVYCDTLSESFILSRLCHRYLAEYILFRNVAEIRYYSFQ
jgi:hypothetical protein